MENKIFKVISLQPYSLYENGGGSRILRRLYKSHQSQVTSIAILTHFQYHELNEFKETIIYAEPITRWWTKWHLRNLIIWLRKSIFKKFTRNKIKSVINSITFDILHVVDQGPFSGVVADIQYSNRQKVWVSFHDHFQTSGGNFYNSKKLWNLADRRLVISEELGNFYQSIFGSLPYEIITDGLTQDEISTPKNQLTNNKIVMYFGGLLHIDYLPLFQSLADALDILSGPDYNLKIKLVLRGTQKIDWLENRLFELEYRPFTINSLELERDLNEANLLYFPIKFNNPYFYLYSMSTKMIGYLGAPGTILYHGPSDSAANNLLTKFQSCISCTTLNKDDLINTILSGIHNQALYSFNAKNLAKEKFNFEEINRKFWLE